MKIYKSKDGDIDLTNLTRLYPASVVDLDGDVSEMSLEWTDMNGDKVKILRYVLVFDFTPQGDDAPHGQEKKIKTTINFDTKEELIDELQKVALLFS